MKTSRLFWLLLVVAVLASMPQASHANTLLTEQTRAVESWYAQQVAGVKDRALYFAKNIPEDDRTLWTEFFYLRNNGQAPATMYIPVENIWLSVSMTDSVFLNTTANFLMDENAFVLLTQIAQSEYEPALLKQYAKKLLPTMEFLQAQLAQLQRARQTKLSELQSTSEPTSAKAVPSQKPGTVLAISWSKAGSMAMIEGIDELVRQGDVINNDVMKNVQIVNITPTAVVFKQADHTWKQIIE